MNLLHSRIGCSQRRVLYFPMNRLVIQYYVFLIFRNLLFLFRLKSEQLLKESNNERNRKKSRPRMQHATCMRQYHLPYLWTKKKKISTMKLYKIGMFTHLFRRCAYRSTCGTILTLKKKIRLCQLTSESQQNEHTSSGIWLLLLFLLNVNSIQNHTKLLCIIKAF